MIRKSAIVIGSFVLVSVLGACGSDSTASEKQNDSKDTIQGDFASKIAQATSKPVEINVFEGSASYTQEQFMDLYGNAIKAKYPNMSFKLYNTNKNSGGGTLNELIAQGVSIDLVKVVSGSSFYSLMDDNRLQNDVTDLIKLYGYDLNQWYPAVLESMKSVGKNGEIYGIPNAAVAAAMFYNKDVFDKFGVAYPKDGMMWDEVYELARRLTRQESGIQYGGFQAAYNHIYSFNQLSQGFVDTKTNKSSVNSDGWKKLFENFLRFNRISGNELISSPSNRFWRDGTLAMYAEQSGGSWEVQKTTPINWDLVELPRFADAPKSGSGLQLPYYAIASTSKNRDQAFLAAAYIGTAEFQKSFARKGYIPPVKIDNLLEILGKDVPQLAGKNIKAAVPMESAAPAYPSNFYSGTAAAVLFPEYALVAQGKKDLNTALRDAEEAGNKKIEELMAARK